MARTVRDAALLLSAVAGFDRRDPFAVAEPVPDLLAACDQPVKGMKVAWSPTLGYADPAGEVVDLCEQAVRTLEDLGCEVELVDAVMDADPIDMWMSEFYAGVGTRLKTMFAGQEERLDPAVAGMLRGALDRTLEEYCTRVFDRYRFREQMRQFMEKYDLLVSPVLPVPGVDAGVDVPPQMPDANVISWVRYTYPFNLTGQPAASVPTGFTAQGLPVGLQLVARTFRETDIFRAAAALEAARPWSDRSPPMA